MKYAISLILFLLVVVVTGQTIATPQAEQSAVPTLTPPTPVHEQQPPAEAELPDVSAVARIAEEGVVRVGILYNEPPFSELNIRGFVSGFDADIANSIANTWEVDTQFVQVMRDPQRTAAMLRDGEIDMVIAAQVRHREIDRYIEYSHTYYIAKKGVMLLADDPAESLADLADRRLGVVAATPAQASLETWLARSGVPVEIVTYPTLDRAYRALIAGDVGGVVDSEHRLQRVAGPNIDGIQILSEPIEIESYAIGFLPQDAAMRDLINRTLHHLTMTGRMDEIVQVHFPGDRYDVIRAWNNLPEDPPVPADYPSALNYPSEYVLPRVQRGEVIRVAGMFDVPVDPQLPQSEQRLNSLHQMIMDDMVSRWGAQVEYINVTGEDALNMVANGEADIAFGVEPDWEWADRVDFTSRYLKHGERLMVRVDGGVVGFTSLRGRNVIVPNNEPGITARLNAIADDVNVNLLASPEREQDLAFALLTDEDLNAAAVFANSLRLISHVRDNANLTMTNFPETTTSRWYGPSNLHGEDYSPRMMVMAVPQNDLEFRLLVEYTLQEIAREGVLTEWLLSLSLLQDIPQFEIWPGTGTHLGFNLSR
ncbi:MAG: hypothetical protein EA396_04130 [Anaerolineaceae bacterium]|nr:MAG: hypothetical protein EA396_04130 [Anaerolineaceae bacterium]